MTSKRFSFWRWFFGGDIVSRPGWKKIVCNGWFLVHVAAVGPFGAFLLRGEHVSGIAAKAVLPMAVVFAGMCFAWSGQASALLAHKDLASFFSKHPDGALNYIYTYQMGIFLLLVTVIYWGMMTLVGGETGSLCDSILKAVGLTLFSISIRECWALPLGMSYMLGIMQKDSVKNEKDEL